MWLNWTYFPLHLTSFSMAVHWFFWTIVRSFWCFLRKLSSSFWCFLVSFIKLFSFFTTSGVMGSNFISSETNEKGEENRIIQIFKENNCNSIICLINYVVSKLCMHYSIFIIIKIFIFRPISNLINKIIIKNFQWIWNKM